MENKKLGKKKELKSSKYYILNPKNELNENEIEK
jgi:hypothetical protein